MVDWPRTLYARVIDPLARAGARVVVPADWAGVYVARME